MVAGLFGSIRPPARRRKGLVVTLGKGRVPDSVVLAGVAREIGLRVTMTLVGVASGPATDGLALVAEGAVSGWLCRLRATLGFMEEQESEAARSLLVRCERLGAARRRARLHAGLRSSRATDRTGVPAESERLAAARPVAGALVLERHLTEPREGIPDVLRVVDRQTTSAPRIDVCKGAVGKLRTLLRAESWPARMIARAYAQTGDRRAR